MVSTFSSHADICGSILQGDKFLFKITNFLLCIKNIKFSVNQLDYRVYLSWFHFKVFDHEETENMYSKFSIIRRLRLIETSARL